jgi:nucleotide-binding universal stress UspA family protein
MVETIFVAVDGGGGGQDALRLAHYLAGADTEFVFGSLTSTADAVDAAHSEDAGLIVTGSARTALHVLHGSPLPVAVAPAGFADGPEDRLRVIGVGFDGQPESRAALRIAERVALEQEATLRVYAVVLPGGEGLNERLHEEVGRLDTRVRAAASVRRGDPAAALTEATREGLDLLVLGSRGYGPLRRVVFGSVSSRLLAAAECPVLVLPRQAAANDQPPTAPAKIAAER